MIKEAHIGVGISGLEGRQAVNNSDFSLGQFRFLARLLLVHGRWSYFRMSRFLRYYFYKNFVFTVAQFWFAFYNGGSAQTDFDPLFISFFNVVYAFLGIVIVGIFEQDVSPRLSMEFPKLYMAGPQNRYFSYKGFIFDLLRGTFHSILMFFGLILSVRLAGNCGADGRDQVDLSSFGVQLSFACVVIVNLQLALEIKHWTWLHVVGILLGPVAWIALFAIIYNWEDWFGLQFVSRFYGSYDAQLGSGFFWAIEGILISICCLPNLYSLGWSFNFLPTPVDCAIKMQKKMHSAGEKWTTIWDDAVRAKKNN